MFIKELRGEEGGALTQVTQKGNQGSTQTRPTLKAARQPPLSSHYLLTQCPGTTLPEHPAASADR